MAVPHIRRAWAFGDARAVRLSPLLDLVVGLLIVLALPLAIVTIPNTVSVVADLLPADVSRVDMTRAYGMALPGLLVTVPLAVLAARRLRAAPLLLAGLALLAGAETAGGFATSPLFAGVLRALQGVGGGLLVCATLLAAWERYGTARRVLLSLWAGALAASLLTAQALALWPLDQATSWQVTLQPYPLVTGLALAVGAAYLVLWLVTGDARATRPEAAVPGRLPAAAAPAVGIAALALGTTFDWPSPLILAAAGVAVVVLFALALFGAPDGTPGRTLAIAMTVAGLVVLPTAAQTTYVELRGVGGPGLIGLWVPFAIAVAAGLAVPVLADRLTRRAAARAAEAHPGRADARDGAGGAHLVTRSVRGGLAVLVAGLAAIRLLVPDADGMVLTVPFTLITVGAAVALAAGLWEASAGAALFALTLCFPGVLAGFLLGTGMQIARVRAAVKHLPDPGPQALVDGFVASLHTWALVGGFTVVAGLALTAIRLRRRADGDAGGDADGAPGEASPGGHGAGSAAERSHDHTPPTVAMDVLVAGGRPVVPPPSPSPEASFGPVGDTGRPEPPRDRRGRDGDEGRPEGHDG